MHPPSLPLLPLPLPNLHSVLIVFPFINCSLQCLNRIACLHSLLDHGVRPVRCGHDQPVAPYRPFCLLPSCYPCSEKKIMLTYFLSGTRVSLRGVGDQSPTTVVDSGRVARRLGSIAATTGSRASSGPSPSPSPAASAAISSSGSAARSASPGALLSPGTLRPSDQPVCQYHIE